MPATEVDLPEFAAHHAAGAVVVDVRETEEYVAGHVPGARHIPLSLVPLRLGELPTDAPVFVICQSGGRSWTAAQLLARAGLDARSVAGGTAGWARSGHPIETGRQAGQPGGQPAGQQGGRR
ncbi:MAG: rhodanese-like domain-containing protein [Actinomycetota bacterium]